MGAGFEVYDENGHLILDGDTLTPRKLGSFRTTTTDGESASFQIPDPSSTVRAVVRDTSAVVDLIRRGDKWEWKYGVVDPRNRKATDVDVWMY